MEQEYRPEEDVDTEAINTPAITTAEELLALARALIADDLLTPEQLAQVQEDPDKFLRHLMQDPAQEEAFRFAAEVARGIVKGYFQSLLAKASEGERFDAKRLESALVKGQVVAVETLTAALGESGTTVDEKIRIAQTLKDA